MILPYLGNFTSLSVENAAIVSRAGINVGSVGSGFFGPFFTQKIKVGTKNANSSNSQCNLLNSNQNEDKGAFRKIEYDKGLGITLKTD